MSLDKIEHELRHAQLPDVEMKKNREVLRNALKTATQSQQKKAKKQRVVRAIFSLGLTVGFSLGIACVWMLQGSRPTHRVATNLGTMWCTYSDASSGGDSSVWPPESTEGQNNFVKSAPGYGEKGYAIRFKGKTGEQQQKGFIGVSTLLGPPSTTSGINIQQFKKIRFKMKGNVSGGELVLLISNMETDEIAEEKNDSSMQKYPVAFEAPITGFVTDAWQTVTLDLRSDFNFSSHFQKSSKNEALGVEDVLADAKNVKWHVRNGKGATVDVWIDELEFF